MIKHMALPADPKARDTRNWRTASSAPPRSRPSRAGTQSPSGRSTSSPSRSVRPPPEVLAATDSYRAINDPLVAFFSYCCRRDDAAATVEAGKLYAAYTAWCDATGERPRSQRSLGVILTERGIQRVLDPQTRRTICSILVPMTCSWPGARTAESSRSGLIFGRKLWRHPASPGEARALEPAFDNGGVAYCGAYDPLNGTIPAVLSVAMVR